jgi:DNA polymerase III subunit alpha
MSYEPEDYQGPTEFVPTHLHTLYSFLDGVGSPQQYVNACHERKWPAIAVTEHGHMASVPDMYHECRKYGTKIKYLSGCEIYLNDYEPERQRLEASGIKVRSKDWRRQNVELGQRINRNRHLTVIAKNEVGFHNLIKLTTQAYETGLHGLGQRQYNRVWFEKLCEYKEGLIILSGCLNGPVSFELRNTEVKDFDGNPIRVYDKAARTKAAIAQVKKYKEAFGDDYFIELQMPGIPNDVEVFQDLAEIARHFKIRPVLANDTHYLTRKEHDLQKIMMAIEQETTWNSPTLFHVNSSEQYLKTRAELWSYYWKNGYAAGLGNSFFEEMCDNTLVVADKCDFLDIDSSPKLPAINDADAELIRLIDEQLRKRGLDKDQQRYPMDGALVTYAEQAAIELKQFIDKGFASYFLITTDLLNHGRNKGWVFRVRGSAGGSLVCYLLGIHHIDPLAWGLSFARFMSPARGGYLLNLSMGDRIKSA